MGEYDDYGMLDANWQGEFWFLDEPVHKMNRKQRAELNKHYIGFVFQSYHLLDNLTVYENLELPLSYKKVKGAQRAGIVADSVPEKEYREVLAKSAILRRALEIAGEGL